MSVSPWVVLVTYIYLPATTTTTTFLLATMPS